MYKHKIIFLSWKNSLMLKQGFTFQHECNCTITILVSTFCFAADLQSDDWRSRENNIINCRQVPQQSRGKQGPSRVH